MIATAASVIMPVLEEERYLAESERRVLAQEYDGRGRGRAGGQPGRAHAHALNAAIAAIAATQHSYIVRVDAHDFLPEGCLRDGFLRSIPAPSVASPRVSQQQYAPTVTEVTDDPTLARDGCPQPRKARTGHPGG